MFATAFTQPHHARAGGIPDLGPNVIVLDPQSAGAQQKLDAIFARQERDQFGSGRFAVLLKPGRHRLDAHLGFYTQLLGLGRSPDDVQIDGNLRATAEWMQGNATCNFWRAAENLSVTPARDRRFMTWAVSQGTQLRRVHIRGDLHLWDQGWSSGGFLADSKIDGLVVSGSQQQWFSRNDEWNRWDGGVWNMVFVGTINPPAGRFPNQPYSTIDATPVIREKPFLSLDRFENLGVFLPSLHSTTRGNSWSGNKSNDARFEAIDRFYIARADRDDADSINLALARGQHLLLTPGIYRLASAINIQRAGTIVLGIGFPTLMPTDGNAAIEIGDVDGVQVAGLMMDAGAKPSKNLLHVAAGKKKASGSDPTVLSDLVCRAGGAQAGSTESFITIDADRVIGDNLWLWRADHGAGAGWNSNKVANGLVVNGNDVTMYGLFVEHCQQYQTLWNGERGRVYFYQSEMPYDPPSQAQWSHDGRGGYASYKVADNVKTHEAFGLGVYCVFNDASVIADSAIEAPDVSGVKLHAMTTIRLAGKPGSGIRHVLNDRGNPVIDTQKSQLESNAVSR